MSKLHALQKLSARFAWAAFAAIVAQGCQRGNLRDSVETQAIAREPTQSLPPPNPQAEIATKPAEINWPTTPPPSKNHCPRTPTRKEIATFVYYEFCAGGSSEPRETVMAIHGLGDTPDNFARFFLESTAPIHVVVPQGLFARGGGFAWFHVRAREGKVRELAEGIRHAAEQLSRFTELLNIKPTVVGFSQGGMLAYALAVHHPQRVHAAVAVSGWLPPPLWPTRALLAEELRSSPPIFAMHGEDDEIVAYAPAYKAVTRLHEYGYPVQWRSYSGVAHSISATMRRDIFTFLAK